MSRLAKLEAKEARLRRMLLERPDAPRAAVWRQALATCRAELRDAYDDEVEDRALARRAFGPATVDNDPPAAGDGDP